MKVIVWTVAIVAAVAVGLWAVTFVPPLDPDGDGLVLNGYVFAKVAPWPLEILRVAALVGIVALLAKWNWTRFMARAAR